MNKVFLIGNAHLDPVWLWQWYEGYSEVKATFRSALDRMKEFPEFRFTSACAQYYEWIKESDPAMFEEIKERVREGRWCITGGWWIQPDCNIPCGESFARHSLISQRFFKKEFGVTARTGYNVDSFGHNGSIPMLLKNSGMDSYVFLRPGPHENPDLSDVFLWESSDGSEVTAFRIFAQYNINNSVFDLFRQIKDKTSDYSKMAFYGIGNHGGGPSTDLLERMKRELDSSFVYSTPDEYFTEMKDKQLPVWKNDLQFHAKGCYSVNSMIKRENRKSEGALLSCEKYSVLSSFLANTPYPSDELARAWKNVLFNQFHDILGGCSVKEAYGEAAIQLGEAQSIADRNINFACQQISWNIDTACGMDSDEVKAQKPEWGAHWFTEKCGTPFVIFNPHPWEITAFVRLHSLPARITDSEGKELPFQKIRASKTNLSWDHWETGLNAAVKPFGYTVLRAFYRGEAEQYTGTAKAYGNVLENNRIRAEFDAETGEISQITDKNTGKMLLSGRTETVMIDETDSDTWAHNIREFKKVAETFRKGSIHVTESGPLRATVRTYQYGENTTIRRDYSVTEGSPVITVNTQIDFHEKHRMLKFRLSINDTAPEAICDIPFGSISRPSDGTEQVCQKWFALKGNECGLAVLNDSKYSFDLNGNTASLTVLRGAVYADHYGERDEFCEYMEQGLNEFTYGIMPFESISDTVKRAEELSTKPFAILETFHKGALPCEYSALSTDKGNIIITAVKKHEDSDSFVIRAYESEGKDTDVNISFLEIPFSAHFGHGQVKTFIIDIKAKTVRETDFLEF